MNLAQIEQERVHHEATERYYLVTEANAEDFSATLNRLSRRGYTIKGTPFWRNEPNQGARISGGSYCVLMEHRHSILPPRRYFLISENEEQFRHMVSEMSHANWRIKGSAFLNNGDSIAEARLYCALLWKSC